MRRRICYALYVILRQEGQVYLKTCFYSERYEYKKSAKRKIVVALFFSGEGGI